MTEIDDFVDALEAAGSVVAFTGAGLSTASGIPDFRGDDGLWTKYDESDFTIGAFQREPAAFWTRWLATHDEMLDPAVTPNAAHDALASLEATGVLDAVITQNVDGLHRAAGSESVLHLHGRGDRAVCQSCGEYEPIDSVSDRFGEERSTVDSQQADAPQTDPGDADVPDAPSCTACGGLLKPDTVLFGEQLPRVTMSRAKKFARDSDVFIAAGSSLTVEPAASLPIHAGRNDATVAIVNMEPNEKDSYADFVFHEDVTAILPNLADALDN